MKPGDVVMIYEDPITRQLKEGRAILVRKIRNHDDGLELWKVRFTDEPDRTFQRFILQTQTY